ncbi:MAG: FAD-binding protein, partial [Alphaproteobacteria bacterium]|nr:FAD-binding protein [Alphaproteobacteria bacterium]
MPTSDWLTLWKKQLSENDIMGIFNKNNGLISSLPKIKGRYIENAKLSQYTWFNVGGPAEVMFIPKDIDDLSFFMRNRAQNIPLFVLGGGSNLLVRDGGIPGVTIKLDTPAFKQISVAENTLTCGAGLPNSNLKKTLLDNNL